MVLQGWSSGGRLGGPIHLQHTLQIKSLSTLGHMTSCPCFCTGCLYFRHTLQEGRNLWLEPQCSPIYSMRSCITINLGWTAHHRSHTGGKHRHAECDGCYNWILKFLIMRLHRMVQKRQCLTGFKQEELLRTVNLQTCIHS